MLSSSEHGEGSDGDNSEGDKDAAENTDPEENEGNTEENCDSENELEQGATTPKILHLNSRKEGTCMLVLPKV